MKLSGTSKQQSERSTQTAGSSNHCSNTKSLYCTLISHHLMHPAVLDHAICNVFASYLYHWPSSSITKFLFKETKYSVNWFFGNQGNSKRSKRITLSDGEYKEWIQQAMWDICRSILNNNQLNSDWYRNFLAILNLWDHVDTRDNKNNMKPGVDAGTLEAETQYLQRHDWKQLISHFTVNYH